MKSWLILACIVGCDPSGPCSTVAGTCVSFDKSSTEAKIQIAFGQAKKGTTFLFGAGSFAFTNELTVSVSDVTIRGAGMDQTTLDFSTQTVGQEGILTTAGGFALTDLTVQNTIGNGVKAVGATGVTYRKVKVTWTNPDSHTHGPYGLYPVQSKNVLIEDCLVEGASDAGVYVGQSEYIVVRHNEVRQNVAGIEIENSHFADVYNNNAHNNTGGLLVFALPALQVQDCHDVRLHDNTVVDNNTDNFAGVGETVGIIPRGTGTFVMASNRVEVFNNTYRDNKTANFAVINYNDSGTPSTDPGYYAFPTEIYVHDNHFMGGGDDPDLNMGQLSVGGLLAVSLPGFPGMKVGDIVYDGVIDQHRTATDPNNPMDICIKSNGDATFLNLHFDQVDLDNGFVSAESNVAPFDCAKPSIDAVTFPGVN